MTSRENKQSAQSEPLRFRVSLWPSPATPGVSMTMGPETGSFGTPPGETSIWCRAPISKRARTSCECEGGGGSNNCRHWSLKSSHSRWARRGPKSGGRAEWDPHLSGSCRLTGDSRQRPTIFRMDPAVGVGLLGAGTVGGTVIRRLVNDREAIAAKTGLVLEVRRVAVQDLTKQRDFDLGEGVLTGDPQEVVDDPSVQLVVEPIAVVDEFGEPLRETPDGESAIGAVSGPEPSGEREQG